MECCHIFIAQPSPVYNPAATRLISSIISLPSVLPVVSCKNRFFLLYIVRVTNILELLRLMKKLIALLAASALTVSAAVVFVKNGRNNESELFSANVEALVRSESGGFGPMCSKTGTSGSYYMKLRSSCRSFGYYDMDVVAYCHN